MPTTQNKTNHKDTQLRKLFDLILGRYLLLLVSVVIFVAGAFLYNRTATPVYKVAASMLIKEDNRPQSADVNEFLNSNLFRSNQNFQNEIWVLKSTPVIEQTVRNLDLMVTYLQKKGLRYHDAYESAPFKVMLVQGHVQPVWTKFQIRFDSREKFHLNASEKDVQFTNFLTGETETRNQSWEFNFDGEFGKLIENEYLAFMIEFDSTRKFDINKSSGFAFMLESPTAVANQYKRQLEFNIIDREATVIEITCPTPSPAKGKDFVNELMQVYSDQNLERKNHIANNTIAYIEKQLGEISDSLGETEDNLQRFRSSNQLLNVTEQANSISTQFMNLQNQLAELVTRKRYYEYVSEFLTSNDDFSQITVPASMGIQDPLLNTLMAELIAAQAQRSNLIENQQERNPLVQKLTIQIENTRKTISENIDAVKKTTELSIEEMQKRINRVEGQISRLPGTQRKLGAIERQYRLNDAIYNYLLEKRAEAKITQASNMPDNIILEPASLVGLGPVAPNRKMNYLLAILLGLALPIGFLTLQSVLNNRIENEEAVMALTNIPILGNIPHNHRKGHNIMDAFPKSNVAESYRSLRTNLDFCFRGVPRKVIMITSSLEGEGKSFHALNIAMSYAQLKRKTLLIDCDLRKPTRYFEHEEDPKTGLSSFLIDQMSISQIVTRSPYENLDYIPSGPIPPNPTELLSLGKLHQLVDELKGSYDYIVLDTTPLAQVSDAYLLMDLAEVKLIVARYNYTHKRILAMILNDLEQKQINKVYLSLNDNMDGHGIYGYGYGYLEKEDFLTRIKRQLRFSN
jgi:tyrosine-protein kinase Etk/Wzc